ncbi:peptidylprolyl isomerase [Arthrobacter caoxuetaonis]|uniref:peptidylprolyl isomerase n=1 Tax=Arthrobacter caoxuetaonis TaxID=2886935 RepID=A0A9X1MFQ3_9MICC|nr:peptidylprolyl isomerase [Arthrobacter caoxuetaonis]MCC3297814.1 peptidylprolyl isomerase [Arthrobacter caoxuetaonis]USQ55995.1 peptidylprolyl isomerase [Arthrobacter caoxuetaonis]
MKVNNRTDRETRRRVARMEARRALAAHQGRRRKMDNVYALTAGALVLALAIALQVFWFSSNPTAEDLELLQREAEAAPATSAPSAIPDPSLAAGQVFDGTLELNGEEVEVELDGNAAPQAVAVFKSLSDSGFFNGKDCHRLVTAETMGVLQCGSADGTGASDPGYQWGPVENTPADGVYPAGSIAVARGATGDSHGTQFFIAYKDSVITQETGGYTIMGKVTSGLEVLETIAASGVAGETQDGTPLAPVTIDSFTLK